MPGVLRTGGETPSGQPLRDASAPMACYGAQRASAFGHVSGIATHECGKRLIFIR